MALGFSNYIMNTRLLLSFRNSCLFLLRANMSCQTPSEYTCIICKDEVLKFCQRCMEKVGVSSSHSRDLADVLVTGDFRGHYSHGLNRLEMYVKDVEKKVCEASGMPVIEKQTVSTALVNGKNLLGPVVGNFSMNLAIEKAKITGTAWVVAYGSNHYGIAGWYSLLAAKNDMIGLSFTNTSPLVYPTRAKKRAVGTNPLTLAAPSAKLGDEFVLDMATSSAALGKIEMCRRRGLSIPLGWGADESGKSSTNPTTVVEKGGLLPLGGEEHTSGYKGYGLGMMVEVVCGILAGAAYGENIRTWMKTDRPANLGQCFIAVDPKAFAPGFKERLSDYMEEMRSLPRAEENEPVLVPGDPERAHMDECERMGGIRYPPVLIESMNSLADRLKVDRMPILKHMQN